MWRGIYEGLVGGCGSVWGGGGLSVAVLVVLELLEGVLQAFLHRGVLDRLEPILDLLLDCGILQPLLDVGDSLLHLLLCGGALGSATGAGLPTALPST